jgi:hypothetical protein
MTPLLSRRAALAAGGAVAAAGVGAIAAGRAHAGGARRRHATEATRIDPPRAVPITRFEIAAPERRRFGALEFRSGLALSSPTRGFGGFSALALTEGGHRLLMVADDGDWLSARVATRDGAMTGLDDVWLAPMLAPDGALMRRVGRYDSEGMTIAPDGFVYVSYERVHEIWRYDIARHGLAARAQPVPTPPETKKLGENKSLEAVAAPPAGHPLDGKLVTIAERPPKSYPDAARATPAWVVPTPAASGGFAFQVARVEEFDVSDAAFLPSGELLILERRFRLTDGVRCRIRRVPAAAIRPGARAEGELIFEAGMAHEIDNLEGLSVHRDGAGDVILTLCSDDNFNWFQRNLLLQFRYLG